MEIFAAAKYPMMDTQISREKLCLDTVSDILLCMGLQAKLEVVMSFYQMDSKIRSVY